MITINYNMGGEGNKPKNAKKQAAASKDARAKRFKDVDPNLDKKLNAQAIDATKNEYGMPLGDQKHIPVKPEVERPNPNIVPKFDDGTKGIRLQKKVFKNKDKYGADEKRGVYKKTMLGKLPVRADVAMEAIKSGYVKDPRNKTNSLPEVKEAKPEVADADSDDKSMKAVEPKIAVKSSAPSENTTSLSSSVKAPAVKNTGKYISFKDMSADQQKQYRAGTASGKDFEIAGIGKYKGTPGNSANIAVKATKTSTPTMAGGKRPTAATAGSLAFASKDKSTEGEGPDSYQKYRAMKDARDAKNKNYQAKDDPKNDAYYADILKNTIPTALAKADKTINSFVRMGLSKEEAAKREKGFLDKFKNGTKKVMKYSKGSKKMGGC